MSMQPSDNQARRFPVSIKGICNIGGRVPLLRNERNEWELPGGKLEDNEEPEVCLIREMREELSIDVVIESLVDVWLYRITRDVQVLIVTYGCLVGGTSTLCFSNEHKELCLVDPVEVSALPMPAGYARSIQLWAAWHARRY
jgi:8-oxo-dGTP pyrophosphatase MutT (NUDIX family)